MSQEDLEKKKAEFLRMLEEEPPYDRERFDEAMKVGHTYEWVRLQENGVIEISISQWLPGGIHGHGTSHSAPGDSDYDEIKARHKLEKTGDTSAIWLVLVDGEWVIDSKERKRSI